MKPFPYEGDDTKFKWHSQTTDIVIYETSFSNGGVLPDGWIIEDEGSGEVIIDNNADYFPNSSGYSGASGGYKVVFTDQGLTGQAYLVYETGVSTLGKENIRLSFGNISADGGIGSWPEYSIDGGAWTALTGGEITSPTWDEFTTQGDIGPFTDMANKANVRFRFRFVLQFTGGCAIDDVKILADLIQ